MTVKYKKFIGLGMLGIFLAGTLGFSGPVRAASTSVVAGVAISVKDTFFTGQPTALPVSAQVLTAGGLTERKLIDLSKLSVSSAGGTITVSEGATGDVTPLDAMSSAPEPGDWINVSLTDQSLSGPGASMPLQGICQSPGSSPGPHNAPCSIVVTVVDAISSALAPGDSITVSVAGQPLSGPGASMPLQGFCKSRGSSPGPNNAPCSIVATSSVNFAVIIGGVIQINIAQAPGTYYGVMEVTAGY